MMTIATHLPTRALAWATGLGRIRLDLAVTLLACAGCLTLYAGVLWGWRVRRELTHWRHAGETARQLATRDPLTGLPNRRRLRAELTLAFARVRRGRGPMALLLINLDRFRHTNDLHGHRMGDLLLRAAAQRLVGSVRETDVVARLSGDEFAVIAEIEKSDDAAQLADRIGIEMQLPFQIDRVVVRTTCRIGIAVAPEDATTPDAVLQRAAIALERTRTESGTTRFFEKGMDERVQQRAALQAALGPAVANDRIELHYQPLIDLRTRRICGFEALARWWMPPRGLISPAEFIPMAEESGLIGRLTDNLLRQACIAALPWPAGVRVAVNISPVQLREPAFPERVRHALRQAGLPGNRLEIEITESALIGNLDLAREIVTELKSMGVSLALDDFGTGYSSLRYLQAIPFDKIKIDAGFIHSMGEHNESTKIVQAVIGLGQSLGVPTVAEGIETEAEADTLLRMGCAIGQGWWFGRPIPATGVDAIFAVARV